MAFGTTALVLVSALLHASWNAILRGGRDRFWSMTVICLAISLPMMAALPFLPRPAPASYPFIIASGLIRTFYNLMLVRMYQAGDLGESYPIARGTSPMLVTLGAAVFAAEWPNVSSLAGILLVSGGIITLALRGRRFAFASAPAALMTGICIAFYMVIDGMGVRLAGSDIGYICWIFPFEILILPVFLAQRGVKGLRAPWRAFIAPVIGGFVSVLAYGIVVVAMSSGPMGSVSALRETSVVFATLIGWAFLGEKLSMRRIGACLVIACGATLLGMAR